MTCPACGEVLTPGQERCSFCEAVVSPPSEGALAPDPAMTAPPPRVEPRREPPGGRRRERTWRDEVNERVQQRRRRRGGLPPPELPLFERTDPPAPAFKGRTPAVEEPPPPPPRELERPELLGNEASDLSLWPEVVVDRPDAPPVEMPEGGGRATEPERGLAHEEKAGPPEVRPVERPALLGERLRAAAVDALLVAAIWTVVVYFAGRAARVPVLGLRPNWVYLAAYLAFLGLVYAAYFTGTTGQTPGKMAFGLRVVDTAGQPPGYLRALVRAALGALSFLAAGLGLLPMAFDPARRALHDRVFRTRVVRS